jgi:dihydroflavonol-4-reductase
MSVAENPNKKVLVTGSTGFVGSCLAEALSRKGHSVTCLVRSTSDTRALERIPVRLAIGDLETPGTLRDAVNGIDTVYHVAGAIKAAKRDEYFRVNQFGTRGLLETLAECNPGLRRFILVSSLAAAGPSPEGRELNEQDKPNPISWYGESKLRSEQEVLKFSEAFRVTIIRPSAVYGPRDRETLLIFRMIKRGCLFTPGRIERRFNLIHVDDLVAALLLAGRQDIPSGEVFFISRPENYSWDEVGRAIAQELGRIYRRLAFPRWVAVTAGSAGDFWAHVTGRPATINSQKVQELLQPSWLCDCSKAMNVFGFKPEIELENGMRNTVRWYQKQGWL